MKIELGKQYTTRSGKNVRIIDVSYNHPTYTVIGYINNQEHETSWTSTGKFYASLNDVSSSNNDLIEIKDDNMKIELGKQYTTRSGQKVKLITIDFDHPNYSVVGCIGDRTTTTSWTSTGRFYASGDISDNDLIESDKAMKIELGKKYKISNGQYVTIVTTKGRQPFPIAGYIGDSNDLRTWRDNGKFYEKEFSDTSLDLIEVGEYDDIKIDEPVLVSLDNVNWYKMHFAGIAENGKPTTFYSGRTSYSNGNNDKPAWDFCKKNDEK